MRRLINLTVALGLAAFATGCSSVTSRVSDSGAKDFAEEIQCRTAGPLAIYAAMAANAYKRGEDELQFDFASLGWTKVDLAGEKLVTEGPSHAGFWTGLALDVYERDDVTVFAFRGTNTAWDWVVANAAIPFSIQYKSANKKVRFYLENRLGVEKRRIVATGHSLGGGLALSVSATERRKIPVQVDAIAFDSSPRVFDGLGNDPPEANRILVHEKGEALERARRYWKTKLDEIVPIENRFFTDSVEGSRGNHDALLLARVIIREGAGCDRDAKRLEEQVPAWDGAR